MTDSISKPGSLKRLSWALGIVALVMSVLTVALIHQYGASRPMVMQEGHSHPVKIHARTVYLTQGEYAAVFVSHAVTIVAIGAFLGVLMKSRRKT
jgi:hypothetical protein